MQNKTVLVIEDNPLNMKLAAALLRIGRYQVLEAVDAETGIQLAREHKPDLILMDIQLPGMNGLIATKLIREDAMLKHIPVVALTSYAMPGDRERVLENGCSGYVSKPIDTRAFLETVSGFLDQEGLAGKLRETKTTLISSCR
jgi:CheY-like chemotaxis protein